MRPNSTVNIHLKLRCILILILIVSIMAGNHIYSAYAAADEPYRLTEAEIQYIENHKDRPLKLSLDPYTGMDYFKSNGQAQGYLIDFLDYVEKDLGLEIEIVDNLSWSEVLEALKNNEIDIIFGANVTAERLKTMTFTVPIYKYPYSVYTLKNSKVKTIGDLDHKTAGFLDGDLMSAEFPNLYKNIVIKNQLYDNQEQGLQAVLSGDIDAFITANGGITRQFVHKYPSLTAIADVRTFTSDMTLSTRRTDQVLCELLDLVIQHREASLKGAIERTERAYNLTILDFTDEERAWLESGPVIRVGAAEDYLPFDYYSLGQYKGISGNLFSSIADQIGLKVEVVSGSFDDLYQLMEKGELDVLNMAKTEARAIKFNFTDAFSEERDEIYGRRELPYIQDIYQLEDAKVAVVKGYWHKDYLEKNLSNVTIVETKDLIESLKLIDMGKADYLIENPTVAQYYIDGLGYSEIIDKGKTSQDSFLYYGINKEAVYLPSIINKTLSLIDYEKVKSTSLMEIPAQQNVVTKKLKNMLVFSGITLLILGVIVIRLIKELIDHKARQAFLEQREKLIFRDGLTGLYNRMYFNHIELALDQDVFPQYFIMTDLNGLKMVNDTYGHAAGDKLILAYTQALLETFEESTVIRMGGDEFMIIVLGCNATVLDQLLYQLSQRCRVNKFEVEQGNWIEPEAAIGWDKRNSQSLSVNDVIVRADQMMYQHKSSLKRRKNDL